MWFDYLHLKLIPSFLYLIHYYRLEISKLFVKDLMVNSFCLQSRWSLQELLTSAVVARKHHRWCASKWAEMCSHRASFMKTGSAGPIFGLHLLTPAIHGHFCCDILNLYLSFYISFDQRTYSSGYFIIISVLTEQINS